MKFIKLHFTILIVLSVMCTSYANQKKYYFLPPEQFLKDVVYGNNINSLGKDESLTLDIYFPEIKTGKKYPMVLLIHGGTFLTGKKEGLGKACQSITDSGFIGVTINYRLGWKIPSKADGCNVDLTTLAQATYRANQDARAALRFLVENAEKYHIDKNWIFIGGGSAGGVTAMSVNYMDQNFYDKNYPSLAKDLGKLDEGSNSLETVYKIKGMCSMWGGLADSMLINASTAVPTIFFHGTNDKVIPYNYGRWRGVDCPNFPSMVGSACIYRQLRALGKAGLLNLIIGGKHGPDEYTHEQMMSNTACFFHSIMSGNAHSGEYYDVITGCR